MPKYQIKGPDGKNYEIEGPAGASDEQVRAAIAAQYPHLNAPAPAPQRPVLSARPKPAPQPAAAPKNWFERAVDAGSGALNKYARPVSATFRGIQDMIPGIDHLAAGANEAGTALGLNHSTLPYSERVKLVRAQREAAMNEDKNGPSTGAAAGHYIGEVAGALGAGMGMGRAAVGAGARIAPKIAPVTNFLQKVAPRTVAAATSKVAKITAGGAGGGAVYGAGNSTSKDDLATNTAEGAAIGAVMAPGFHAGLKLAAALGRPIADMAGISSAASILKRYVKTSAEELQARAAAWTARTGATPTIFEILPLADRQKVQGMLGIVPGETKERAAALIKQRAGNIGPEISDKAKAVIHPARQTIIDGMADDIAKSRGDAAPGPQDIALAERAGRDPAALNETRKTINSNIMYRHDPKPVATLAEITPQEPQLQADGSVQMVDLDPEMTRIIRSAAGTRAASAEPLTVSETTAMISKLRDVANKSKDFNQASAASRAAQHLEDQLPADAAEAFGRMTENNIHYKNKAEGWKAGLKSDLRENVDPTGNFQLVRNQFDTPGGAHGRVLGQASALDQQLNMRPGQALVAADDIATNPTTTEAIDRNIGSVAQPDGSVAANAGTQLADAAAAQTDSARNLVRLNPDQPDPGADLPTLAANLIRLTNFSPGSKAAAANAILRSFSGLPQKQATQLVDALFSQDPAKISMGLKFMHNAGSIGREALSTLQQSFAVGGAAGLAATTPVGPDGEHLVGTGTNEDGSTYPQYGTATPDASVADNPLADPAAAAEAPQPGTPVDPASSPYMAQLQGIYDNGDPKLLSLANTLEGKESNHNHFNADGTPKISSAGAIGLMQVMPGTARSIAQQRGITFDDNALHHDPAYNKLLGVHLLDQLLTKYNGDRVKAAAAYNWRPDALDRTIAEHPNDWQVHLPSETSKYIQGIEP